MKVKANSVKQEYEKQDELKRSALRAVAALLTIPDAGKRIIFCVLQGYVILYHKSNLVYTVVFPHFLIFQKNNSAET